jgi:hypothetical protein
MPLCSVYNAICFKVCCSLYIGSTLLNFVIVLIELKASLPPSLIWLAEVDLWQFGEPPSLLNWRKFCFLFVQCAQFGTKIFVLDGMNLRRPDMLFLALGLLTMFSAFGVFAKKLMRWCSLRQVTVVPFVDTKGTTTPSRFEHRHMSSMVATPVFVLKWYSAPWTRNVVLNFLFLCMKSREASPLPSIVWVAEVDPQWSYLISRMHLGKRCSYVIYLMCYCFLAHVAFSLLYRCFPGWCD